MTPLSNPIGKRGTLGLVLLAWLLAGAFASPSAFFYAFKYIADPAYGIKPYCTTYEPAYEIFFKSESGLLKKIVNFGSKYFETTHDAYIVATLMVQYVLPLVYLVFAYSRMSLKLWRNQIPGNEEQNRDETLIANKKKSIKMMVSVVIIFGLCWLPWQVFSIIQVFWQHFIG